MDQKKSDCEKAKSIVKKLWDFATSSVKVGTGLAVSVAYTYLFEEAKHAFGTQTVLHAPHNFLTEPSSTYANLLLYGIPTVSGLLVLSGLNGFRRLTYKLFCKKKKEQILLAVNEDESYSEIVL